MRMHHAAAEDLDPAGSFAEAASFSAAFETAHIHLCARLCEREMVRTEFRLCLCTEQFFGKHLQRSLQICKGNVLVDDKPFDLMEGW